MAGFSGILNWLEKRGKPSGAEPRGGPRDYGGEPYMPQRPRGGADVGADYLRQILQYNIAPQARRLAGGAGEAGERFEQAYGDIGTAGLEYATKATEAYGQDLFRAGGPIQEALMQATGQTVRQGFGPSETGAFGEAQRRIQTEGQRAVGNFFTQQALAGRQQDIGIAGLAGQQSIEIEKMLSDYITSLFTGAASAEQLQFSKWALNRQL